MEIEEYYEGGNIVNTIWKQSGTANYDYEGLVAKDLDYEVRTTSIIIFDENNKIKKLIDNWDPIFLFVQPRPSRGKKFQNHRITDIIKFFYRITKKETSRTYSNILTQTSDLNSYK